VVLTTSTFLSFAVLQLAMLGGIVTNAYVGLIVYMLFPVLFVLGLLIIPVAWYRQRRRTGLTTRELVESGFGHDAVAGVLPVPHPRPPGCGRRVEHRRLHRLLLDPGQRRGRGLRLPPARCRGRPPPRHARVPP